MAASIPTLPCTSGSAAWTGPNPSGPSPRQFRKFRRSDGRDPALSRRGFLAVSVAAGLGVTALSGCGGDSDGGSSSGTTTIEWWNISTTEPAKTVWANLAKTFEAQNPQIKIKIVQLENDAYKSKMTALTASGKLPDLFHTWGGGVLAQQVDAGLVEDLTDRARPWADGLLPVARQPYLLDDKLYGIPFDIGMVGFRYNKALFRRAGIGAPPASSPPASSPATPWGCPTPGCSPTTATSSARAPSGGWSATAH